MRILFILCYSTCFFLTAASAEPMASSAVSVEGSDNNTSRIFSVCGCRLHDGLPVKGILIYTNHAQSVQDVLPEETRAFIADAKRVLHLIPEYDFFSASMFETPYHSAADFVREGFMDPEFCLTDHLDFSQAAEIFESFFPGEYEGKSLWSML